MPSSSSAGIFRFLEETTIGTIASGNPQTYRVVSGTLKQSTTSIDNNELRSDRGRGDTVLVSGSVNGDLMIDLSFKTHDTFIEALLASTWSNIGTNSVKTVSDMVLTTGTNIITSATNLLPLLDKGQWFKITGSSNTSNNGVYRASTTVAPTIGSITVDPVVKAIAGTTTSASTVISAARIKQGNATLRAFTIEREISDIARFFTWKSCFVSGLKLSYTVGAAVNGSFSFLGQSQETLGTVSLFPGIATAVAATTTPIINSVTNAILLIDDVTLGTSCLESFSIDIIPGLRERRCIGNGIVASSIAADQFKVTGQMNVFFGSTASATLYGKELLDGVFNLCIQVQDANGMCYVICIPRGKITSADVTGGAIGSDVMMTVAFQGVTDPTMTSMIMIDRLGTTV